MYRFDAVTFKLIWVEEPDLISESANLDLGSGDLSIDTGDRTNDSSIIDQGLR